MKKNITILFLLIMIIPSIAFASWWNPFSWKIFSFLNKKYTPIQTNIIEKGNGVIPSLPIEKETVNINAPLNKDQNLLKQNVSTKTGQPTQPQKTKTKNESLLAETISIPKLDSTQFMFISPAQNSKVKIGDNIVVKIVAGEDIDKVQFQASFSNIYKDIPLVNGKAEFNLEVPESLESIFLSLDGWTKEGRMITDVAREMDGLDTTGTYLSLKPYTNYKVIEIHGVPNVIEAQAVETYILPEPLYAEFENNTLGGLIKIPYSDINFKIENENIIKLVKFGETYKIQGIKSGETYLDITYMGIVKKIPMYFR